LFAVAIELGHINLADSIAESEIREEQHGTVVVEAGAA